MNPREGTPQMENLEIPAEIADARDLADTMRSNRDAAEADTLAALEEFTAAQNKLTAARNALYEADQAEAGACSAYVEVLRRHGYVQTADGPRPAHTVHS